MSKTTIGSSTLASLNQTLVNMTAASRNEAKSKPRPSAVKDAITYEGLTRKSEKKEVQTHTLEDALRSISEIRKRIGNLYAQGKFNANTLASILTQIDNAIFFKSCGEFDRAIAQCNSCALDLDNRNL